MERSRNYLVNQAIDQLLALHTWQIERAKEGIKAADELRFVGDAEMERILNKYKTANRACSLVRTSGRRIEETAARVVGTLSDCMGLLRGFYFRIIFDVSQVSKICILSPQHCFVFLCRGVNDAIR